MNFHETKMEYIFFEHQVPQLVKAVNELIAALSTPAPAVNLPVSPDPKFLDSLFFGRYQPEVYEVSSESRRLNHAINLAHKALMETLRDPKTQIPSWCPCRKFPAESRVYCYKDSNTWYLHYLIESRGIQSSPSGFEYAVRYEGIVESTAREFYEQLQQKHISDILGFHVEMNEVIEIDDGLVPYYFHISDHGVDVLTYFNRGTARKNKLEHSTNN